MNTNINKINKFFGETKWLSNFYIADILYNDTIYPTTEHAYQAQKTINERVRQAIAKLPTPADAAAIGRELKTREDWKDISLQVMYEVNKIKFTNHEHLKNKLLETGDAYLEEGNKHHDMFYGVCNCEVHNGIGKNHLGKILMIIRTEIYNEITEEIKKIPDEFDPKMFNSKPGIIPKEYYHENFMKEVGNAIKEKIWSNVDLNLKISKFPIVQGSVVDATEDIIVHQVNCKGVMGSGIAKAIRDKYPEVFESYRKYIFSSNLLGKVNFVHTFTNNLKIVANVFSQNGFGNDDERYTNYEALYSGLERVFEYAKRENKSVAIPVKIGCGLGGGNWNIVKVMIEEIFNDPNIKVTLYEYGK